LSNTRFTANAIVSGNFIPSTTPLTSNAAGHIGTNVNPGDLTGKVHFLLGSDPNGGLIDITGRGIVRTTGFAKGTNDNPKYGIGSIQYNGFTDSVYMLGDGCLYGFGTGDYTVEFWCNFDDVLRTQYLYDSRLPGQTTGSFISIYLNYAVQFTQVGTTGSAYDVQSGAGTVVFTVQDASTVAGITSNYAVGNKIRASLPNPAQGYIEATISDYTGTQLTAAVSKRFGAGSGTSWIVSDAANGTITANINSNTRIEGVVADPNRWYFVTLTRYLGTVRFFVDGVKQGADTSSLDNYGCAVNRPIFGVNGSTGNTNWFRGWMDDIRITKFSRYYDNFDVPTSALPITGVPPAPPKVYRVFAASANVDEGNSINFAVSAINFGSGKLYYTILGPNVTDTDFADNTLSGEINIISDGGNLTKQIAADMLTEGPETFVFQVRTGSINGPIVATSSPVTINDTSTTPPPTYSIAVDVSQIAEGDTATFTITTTRVGNDTLYWTNSGTTSAADFDSGNNNGAILITNDSATKAFTLTMDHLTEGTETLVFELRTGSITGPIVATASVVVVADTSVNAPVYKVTPDKTDANEGDTVTWNIQTFYYGSGTLYYTITGTVTAPDFTTLGGGLQLTKYNDYFNNNLPYFDNTTPILTSQTVSLSLTNVSTYTSYMYTGWLLADYTGTWTFDMTTSATNDDLAYMWIGVNAAANYTPLNVLLAEKGQHVTRTKTANINLVKGNYYPFRLVYGNHMGAGSLSVSYSNLLVTNSTDFTGKLFFSPDGLNGGKVEGPVLINNDSGSITKTLALDFLTEGMENAVLMLHTGSTTGPVVATSDIVNINDTSIAPVPSYAIVPNATTVDEGRDLVFTITTTNFGTGIMYWKNIGTSTADDFIMSSSDVYEGTVQITNDTGIILLYVKQDLLTEGQETVQIQLRLNSQTDPVIATSAVVTINDTSTTPPPSYSLTADTYTMNENDIVTFTFVTANTPDAVYTWRNVGTTSAADFIEGLNTDTLTTVNGTATFSLTTLADLLTEGTETIVIVIANSSNVDVATASSIKVFDTSTTPPPTFAISPSVQITNEGTTVTYTVQTTNFGSGVLFWSNRGTTTALDFVDNVNSGSVTIANDIGFFTRQIKNDFLTEGSETIIMDLRTDSISGAVQTSSVATTVNDTSIPLVTTYNITPSTTSIGETVFNKTYDGTAYDTFPNVNLSTGPFTIEAWFNPANLNQGLNFFGMSNGSGSVPKLAVYMNSGKLTVDMGSVGSAPNGQFPFTLTPSDWGISANNWFHFALVRENTNANGFKIYINGSLAGITTNSSNLAIITGNLYYAYIGEAYGTKFVGTIQNFYITKAAVYTAPFTPVRTTTTTVTWSIQTTNYGNGTLYWVNKGTTKALDFLENAGAGTVNVVNDTATLVLNVIADNFTEGAETIIIELHSGSITGPLLKTAATVTVNDTSITPTFTVVPKLLDSTAVATSMNEGDTLIYYITTAGFGTGTLYYNNGSGGSLGDLDVADNVLNGSITVVNDVATVSKTVLMDKWTEGLNSFNLSFHTISPNGPVVYQTPVVNVLDASVYPTTLAVGIYGRGYKGTPISNGVYNPYWTKTAVVQNAAVSSGPIGYGASYAQLDPNGYTVEYTGYFMTGVDGKVTLSVSTNLPFVAWLGAWAVPQKDGNWGSLTVADTTAVMSYLPTADYGTAQSFTRTYNALSQRGVPVRVQIHYPPIVPPAPVYVLYVDPPIFGINSTIRCTFFAFNTPDRTYTWACPSAYTGGDAGRNVFTSGPYLYNDANFDDRPGNPYVYSGAVFKTTNGIYTWTLTTGTTTYVSPYYAPIIVGFTSDDISSTAQLAGAGTYRTMLPKTVAGPVLTKNSPFYKLSWPFTDLHLSDWYCNIGPGQSFRTIFNSYNVPDGTYNWALISDGVNLDYALYFDMPLVNDPYYGSVPGGTITTVNGQADWVITLNNYANTTNRFTSTCKLAVYKSAGTNKPQELCMFVVQPFFLATKPGSGNYLDPAPAVTNTNSGGTAIWQMGYTVDGTAVANPTSTQWNSILKYNTGTNGI
jgi:hypothetical protein